MKLWGHLKHCYEKIKHIQLGLNVLTCTLGNVCSMLYWKKFVTVFHASVLLLILNFGITFDNVMMKFIVNNRTDTKKLTSICFYINKLWNWPLLLVDASHQLYNLVSLSLLSMKSSQWVQNNFFTANLRGKRNSS